LSTEQQFILNAIYQVFEEHGAWPVLQTIESRLYKEFGADLLEQLKTLPPELVMVYGNPDYPQPGDTLHLTFQGMHLAGGDERLEKAVQMLQWFVERQLGFEPSNPLEAQYLTISASEGDEHFGWSRDDSRRTYLILQELWGWMQSGGAGTLPDGSLGWSASLSPDIRQLRNLKTIEDLIRVQLEQRRRSRRTSTGVREDDETSSATADVEPVSMPTPHQTVDSVQTARPEPPIDQPTEGLGLAPTDVIEHDRISAQVLADAPTDVDELDFGDYARALADFISHPRTDKPLTIAIDAPWGMGKTSLMKMIERELKGEAPDPERALRTVWFNPWTFDQEPLLWPALPLEILAETRKQFSLRQRIAYWVRWDRSLGWGRFVARLPVIRLLIGDPPRGPWGKAGSSTNCSSHRHHRGGGFRRQSDCYRSRLVDIQRKGCKHRRRGPGVGVRDLRWVSCPQPARQAFRVRAG